jgi:hypothetical protein
MGSAIVSGYTDETFLENRTWCFRRDTRSFSFTDVFGIRTGVRPDSSPNQTKVSGFRNSSETRRETRKISTR